MELATTRVILCFHLIMWRLCDIIRYVINICDDTIYICHLMCDWSLCAHKIIHSICSLKMGVTLPQRKKSNATFSLCLKRRTKVLVEVEWCAWIYGWVEMISCLIDQRLILFLQVILIFSGTYWSRQKKDRELSSPSLLSFVADHCFDCLNLIMSLAVFGINVFGT
jgi:hypothetical protein